MKSNSHARTTRRNACKGTIAGWKGGNKNEPRGEDRSNDQNALDPSTERLVSIPALCKARDPRLANDDEAVAIEESK